MEEYQLRFVKRLVQNKIAINKFAVCECGIERCAPHVSGVGVVVTIVGTPSPVSRLGFISRQYQNH